MISEYEDGGNVISGLMAGGRQYALGQKHKHLPEIVKLCALSAAPAFCPIVVPHHSGMEVTVPAEQVVKGDVFVKNLLILEFFRLKTTFATNFHLAQSYTKILITLFDRIACSDF